MPRNHQFNYVTSIAMMFVTAIVISNIIAVKILHWGIVEVPTDACDQ